MFGSPDIKLLGGVRSSLPTNAAVEKGISMRKLVADLLSYRIVKGWLALLLMLLITLAVIRVGLWMYNVHPKGTLSL